MKAPLARGLNVGHYIAAKFFSALLHTHPRLFTQRYSEVLMYFRP